MDQEISNCYLFITASRLVGCFAPNGKTLILNKLFKRFKFKPMFILLRTNKMCGKRKDFGL